jgi:Ca2+-dependent lipid-binding protein
MQGLLKIHVHEARLTHDTETFGKMDPYCVFEMREQRVRTRVCQDQGKTPNWQGEVVTFDIKYIGDDIHLSCWDDDPGKDDLIGQAEIKVATMCIGSGLDEWYKLYFKGKEAGMIHLRSVWEPRHG